MSRLKTDWHKWTAIGTLVLAFATVVLAYVTFRLEGTWERSSTDQVGVQTWLSLSARFDSKEIKQARSELAQLMPYSQDKHDLISEDLLDVLEDIGTLYNRGLINKQLTSSSFGYYATRWWEALQPYVYEERRRHGDDSTLFVEFEIFAKVMRKDDPKIDSEALKKFLAEESHIKTQASTSK